MGLSSIVSPLYKLSANSLLFKYEYIADLLINKLKDDAVSAIVLSRYKALGMCSYVSNGFDKLGDSLYAVLFLCEYITGGLFAFGILKFNHV